MQYRMKTHQLTGEQIRELLEQEQVGVLATVNADGTPYVTPMHFVYHDGALYLHGLPAGQKVSNLKRCGSVCFTVYHMDGLLLDGEEKPCDTNTAYRSVILNGTASFLEDPEAKRAALGRIIAKYTPQLTGRQLPDNMVRGTAVIRIEITSMTGKYWE